MIFAILHNLCDNRLETGSIATVKPARLSHADLADRLRSTHSKLSASEAHGITAGLVAAGARTTENLLEEGLPEVPTDDPLAQQCRASLDALFMDTVNDFADASFGFSPLLPPDSAPLSERSGALRDWCEGFLYGFGIADTVPPHLTARVAEALQDIGELARLDPLTVGKTEEEEASYCELVEFLRMAALLIHEEILDSRGTAS